MTYPLKFRQQVLAIRQKENLTFKQTAERVGAGMATVMHRARNPQPVTKRNKPATKIDMQLLAQGGVLISGSGVRSVWLRHDLKNMKKRLSVPEARVAQDGYIFTEAQLQALEKVKDKRETCGEIDSQDTYYVGHVKGIGKIYQQIFIDTYSRVAFTKVYMEKNALVAADMLNDQVLPLYDAQEVPLLRILTDRGSEYCGKKETHACRRYLNLEDIEHTPTKAYCPQTSGVCERFHKTMKNECYDVMFRRKIYGLLEEIQQDIEQWLLFYNRERPHSDRHCQGKPSGKLGWHQKGWSGRNSWIIYLNHRTVRLF